MGEFHSKRSDMRTINGEALKKACIKSAYAMMEISTIIGRSDTFVKNACDRNRICVADLIKICKLLKRDPDDFIVEENEPEEPKQEEPKQEESNTNDILLNILVEQKKIEALLLEYLPMLSELKDTWK